VRQTLRYRRARVVWQTRRNVRFGFPQRGRYASVPGSSITSMGIVLPLTAGHSNLDWMSS
jgi:hypothetical protein